MRTEKGQPGYVKARKQKYLLGAVVEFAIVIAIFVTGYIQTGSRLNLLTVVAVVGCLPAAKMLVEFITMAPYKSIEEAKYQELEEKAPLILKAYDMIITSYTEDHAAGCCGSIRTHCLRICQQSEDR